jgi:hypothetical protein
LTDLFLAEPGFTQRGKSRGRLTRDDAGVDSTGKKPRGNEATGNKTGVERS